MDGDSDERACNAPSLPILAILANIPGWEVLDMVKSRKPARTRSVSATEAQNNFGEVLARVARDGKVFITRYRRPEAVVLSMQEYEALAGVEPVDLDTLEREFDSLVARMQFFFFDEGQNSLGYFFCDGASFANRSKIRSCHEIGLIILPKG